MARKKRQLPENMEIRGPDRVKVNLRVNRKEYQVFIEPRQTLLDTLRKDLGLTGAKKGCDEGTCGACTVLIDGSALYSCITLAIECEGRSIETIEGISTGDALHPVQKAFIDQDAFQCGFCTPGQILSVKALLDAKLNPSPEEIKTAVAGNICRCGAYSKIIQAAQTAAAEAANGSRKNHDTRDQDKSRIRRPVL